MIEDLHWADESSLLLLTQMARVTSRSRLLILGTGRHEGLRDSPLFAELQDALGSRGAFTVDLESGYTEDRTQEGLTFCAEYLMARYGTTFIPELPRVIYELTKANPLFLTETLGYLEDHAVIARRDNRWALSGSIADMRQLPRRVEHVMRHRMNRLDEDLAAILKCGSVEGHHFTLEVIARIRAVEHRHLLKTIIDSLVGSHRLITSGLRQRLYGGINVHVFSFYHIMAQRYVYDYLLTPIERQMLHEDVANSLEHLCGDSASEIAPQLATHFSLAGEVLRTIKYALIAGERFIAEYGWSEAVKFARLGLSTWQQNPQLSGAVEPEVLVRLRLLHARAEAQGGIRSEESDHIQAGIDILLPSLDEIEKIDRQLAAQVYLVLGQLLTAKQVTSEYERQ